VSEEIKNGLAGEETEPEQVAEQDVEQEEAAEQKEKPKPPNRRIPEPNRFSIVNKVIAVASGKGGVGKSLVTGLLSVMMRRKGHNVSIIDADMTGPSIPKMFGVKEKMIYNQFGIVPGKTESGIQMVSVNMILDDETDPVIWRGSMMNAALKQFWTEVVWREVDYMFVDMPPGTGDVPMSVFQTLPIAGIIIVASPQELVSMVVTKAVKMAEMMDIPIIGIVENMSYLSCPDCDKKIRLFGESHIDEIASKHNLTILGKIPIDPQLAALCDAGRIEDFEGDWLDKAAEILEAVWNLPPDDLEEQADASEEQ